MPDMTASIFGARVSLATAAVAGLAAAGQDVALVDAVWAGVKLVHVVFGCVGAAITLSVVQGWSWARVVTTLLTGIGLAALATPFALHYVEPPAALATIAESAYAAILGAVGVYAIPGLHNAAKTFAANPFGVIDWMRGRGAPPSPPGGPGGAP